MNSEKKYFYMGILASIIFGVFVNLLSPFFEKNVSATVVLLFLAIALLISVAYNDIQNWLAKKSIISKSKRILALQDELEKFNQLHIEIQDTHKFILVVVKKFLLPFLVLLYGLFSKISIGAIFSILLVPQTADISDWTASLNALTLFAIVIEFARRTNDGWYLINNLVYPDKYRQYIQKKVRWLETQMEQRTIDTK